ncbi:MAG: cyclodeaminase/cyclohydrolase family protein [Deltaproteobacteria bacterium]|nr:cyclodeaminase/cyclohydrolase family protein [Deltaproteobacteria bacterium]
MLSELKFKKFCEKTASNDPVPGGGSVSAMAGAIAASLSEMVANLTLGRKGFESFDDEMKTIIKESQNLKILLTEDIDRDSNSYDDVIKAFRMPKESEEDKIKRSEAIQEATKHAAMVPLSVAERALEVIYLTEKVVNNGNPNAVTDGAVACMMARTAVLGALYNVKINLSSIKDQDFVNELSCKVEKIEKKAIDKEKTILNNVNL